MTTTSTSLFELLASGEDNPHKIEQIITKNRIDVNSCYQNGISLLMSAASSNAVKSGQALLNCGAKVNFASQEVEGITALLEAVTNNDLDFVSMLIRNEADVNLADQSGNTPLMYCAMMNAGPEIVAALWDAGADDSLVNKNGQTFFDLALDQPNKRLVKSLFNLGMKNSVYNSRSGKGKGFEFFEEESEESDDEESEPEPTWLEPILTDCGTPAHWIYLCEEKLVREEGFGCAQTYGRTPASLVTRDFLQGLGITGVGIQQVLLDLHAELHHEFLQQKKREKSIQLSRFKPHDAKSGEDRPRSKPIDEPAVAQSATPAGASSPRVTTAGKLPAVNTADTAVNAITPQLPVAHTTPTGSQSSVSSHQRTTRSSQQKVKPQERSITQPYTTPEPSSPSSTSKKRLHGNHPATTVNAPSVESSPKSSKKRHTVGAADFFGEQEKARDDTDYTMV